ncbi:hypothetical protein Gotur_006605 [Gossypium turneri]
MARQIESLQNWGFNFLILWRRLDFLVIFGLVGKKWVHVEIIYNHPQFILIRAIGANVNQLILIALVYGSPNRLKRKNLWEALHAAAANILGRSTHPSTLRPLIAAERAPARRFRRKGTAYGEVARFAAARGTMCGIDVRDARKQLLRQLLRR